MSGQLPLWDLPPPPPPPWLKTMPSCSEDGGCSNLPAINSIHNKNDVSMFHNIIVILVSSATIVITLFLLAVIFWSHRRSIKRAETFFSSSRDSVKVEERFLQRCCPNQYMGEEGRVNTVQDIKSCQMWRQSCSDPPSTSSSDPIYETIDDSYEAWSSCSIPVTFTPVERLRTLQALQPGQRLVIVKPRELQGRLISTTSSLPRKHKNTSCQSVKTRDKSRQFL